MENEIYIDIGLWLTYILAAAAILGVIVFPIMAIISAPKSFIKSLYFLGGLIVLFGISWAISSANVFPTWAVQGVTESSSKMIGAGLITLYILTFAAVLGIVYSEVTKVFK